jgi:hypothetical protein
MFQLHDRTRRRACLAALVLFGAIPLLVVAGWCLDRHLPGSVQSEADALGRQLGLLVKLEDVKHLRPGSVLYEGLELSDPETGRTIFRSRCLEVVRQTAGQDRQRPALCVIASQPQVEADNIDLAWRWLQRSLQRPPGQSETDIQFSAAEVTLRAGDRSQTLTDVAALLETLPKGTQAQVDFRLAGDKTPDPASIRVVRNREGDCPDFRVNENGTVPFGATTRFELATGDSELPCSVLAMGLAELRTLGERCRFHGQICAYETPDGWNAEVAGQLVDLSLDRLFSDRFRHRLTGIGKASIESARFHRGRLEDFCGVLVAERGTVSRSLLAAAVDRLGVVPGAEPIPVGERIPYHELAMSITLDAEGLRLRGLCSNVEPGTILSDGRVRIVGEPSRERQPIAALVQTLVPQSELLVPANRQTVWLLNHLLIRDVSPAPGTKSPLPTARARWPEWQR